MTEHRPSRERREEIIEAMIETMAEYGYARATITKIADTAGLTPGLLHYHFPNKKEILRGALARLAEQQALVFEQLIESHESPGEALDAVLVTMLSPGRDAHPARVAAWVAILAEAIREPDIASDLAGALVGFRETLRQLLVAGVDSGELDLGDESAEEVSAGLIALFQGYFAIGVTARTVVPRGSALRVARRMVEGFRT